MKQIGLMLASITNESNLALKFQIFGIQIVMTGPGIAADACAAVWWA